MPDSNNSLVSFKAGLPPKAGIIASGFSIRTIRFTKGNVIGSRYTFTLGCGSVVTVAGLGLINTTCTLLSSKAVNACLARISSSVTSPTILGPAPITRTLLISLCKGIVYSIIFKN